MQRSISVDLLRFVAFFLVCFGRHLSPYPGSESVFGITLHKVTSILACGGWVGVDLFFVLSGFLVSGLLFREHQKFGTISAKRFLIRRGLKIYPAFWLLLAVTVGVKLLNGKFRWATFFSELLFVQNYGPFFWGHAWSLAVEEHFYLLLVLLLLYLSRRISQGNPFRLVPAIFIILATLTLAGRLVTARMHPSFDYWIHQFHSHLRLDSLFFGVLISYFFHYHNESFSKQTRKNRWWLLLSGIAALFPAFVFPIEKTPWIYIYGFTLFYLGAGALLVAFLAFKPPETKPIRLAAYLGSHSYSIYLWHMPVSFWLIPAASRMFGDSWNWGLYAAVYISAALGIGVTMALLIEFPTLRVRDRWFPSRARFSDSSAGDDLNSARPVTSLSSPRATS
jgi:peptidoglycan/LPS O-acetylase OafA/YrhL